MAKVIVNVFPAATRRFKFLNNQNYASYVGIRRCEVSEEGLPEPADFTNEGWFSVPTIFKVDHKPVKIDFNVWEGIIMLILPGGEKWLVDSSLIDVPNKVRKTGSGIQKRKYSPIFYYIIAEVQISFQFNWVFTLLDF